jgi:uncharacterized protein YkwD
MSLRLIRWVSGSLSIVALGLGACGEVDPAESEGGARPVDSGASTDAGSVTRDASTPPSPMDASTPPATPCELACRRVYQECGVTFRDATGNTVSQSQCVQGCTSGMLNGGERCLASVECTQAAITACVSGGTRPPADAGSPPPRDAGTPPPPPSSPEAALEERILAIVNQRRAMGANCGGTNYGPAGPLTMNEQLRTAARAHSLDMGTRNYFNHNTPEGRTPFQRTAAAGYSGSPQGENIAAGNATAEATMTQWMNSPGHCTNIMNPQYRVLGVGYARVAGSRYTHYWTQNFGGR